MYHSIKLPFDAEAAEKILNVIYYLPIEKEFIIHIAKCKCSEAEP